MKLDCGAGQIWPYNEEKEIIINKNTNEELSIMKKPLLWNGDFIEIKRGALKKILEKSDYC